ncbi:MAG: isoprenylcysteine carboxylmethyltransferase family protein [Thermoanaerobaculia bacterium]|jgi:protein-S-isoprenylcysteine O-methyltransferase Ste14
MQINVPPVFRYPEAIAFWIIYVWAFVAEGKLIRKSLSSEPGPQDQGTMRFILIANQTAIVLAFGLAFVPWGLIPQPRAALVVGTLLLLSGGVLRRICFRTLGRHFTGTVTVTQDQPVIQDGPYRWVRHPSYAAGLLLFLGVGIALGSLLSVAALMGLSACAYSRRVRAEEIALVETLGEPYREYMRRTKRFIPFVY